MTDKFIFEVKLFDYSNRNEEVKTTMESIEDCVKTALKKEGFSRVSLKLKAWDYYDI